MIDLREICERKERGERRLNIQTWFEMGNQLVEFAMRLDEGVAE